jgi:hypothetical protein
MPKKVPFECNNEYLPVSLSFTFSTEPIEQIIFLNGKNEKNNSFYLLVRK